MYNTMSATKQDVFDQFQQAHMRYTRKANKSQQRLDDYNQSSDDTKYQLYIDPIRESKNVINYRKAADNTQLHPRHLDDFYKYHTYDPFNLIDLSSVLEGSDVTTLDNISYAYPNFTAARLVQAVNQLPRNRPFQISFLGIRDDEPIVVRLAVTDTTYINLHEKGVTARWYQYTMFNYKSGYAQLEDFQNELTYKYKRILVSPESIVIRPVINNVSSPNKLSIFGATSTELHCIDKILLANKRKLTNFPPGINVNVEQIEPVIKKNRDVHLIFHNRLSVLLDDPIMTIGRARDKNVTVVNQFCHFTQSINRKAPLEQAIYTPHIDPQDPNLKDAFNIQLDPKDPYQETIISYISLKDDKLTITKTYQPPDPSPFYYTTTNETAYYFKRFVQDNNLQKLTNYNSIIASAFQPPPMVKRAHLTKNTIELDRNKAYPSSISPNQPFYRGFPTNSLIAGPTDPTNPNLAFVITTSVKLTPAAAFYFQKTALKVIPAPLYFYLISTGSIIHSDHSLFSTFQDLNIDNIPSDDKYLRNTIIGKLIQNNASSKITFHNTSVDEFRSIQYTATKHNLPYAPLFFETSTPFSTPETITMTVDLPPKPLYQHVHSYIMAYHNITMLRKITELGLSTVQAVFVDAIFTTNNSTATSLVPGEFKQDRIKDCHRTSPLDVKHLPYEPLHLTITDLTLLPFIPTSRVTFISGPAGSGKSYQWLNTSIPILTPTLELKRHHKKNGNPSNTVARFFQFQLSSQVYKAKHQRAFYQPIYVIDEFTMFTREQYDQMIHRQPTSFFVFLGDTNQVFNTINGTSIVSAIQDLREHTSQYRRQTDPDFIQWLDSLRDMSTKQQIQQTKARYQHKITNDITSLDLVIGGQHSNLHQINHQYLQTKQPADMVPVRYTKPGKSTTKLNIQLSTVPELHNRKTFQEPKQLYEIAFASTIDSYQGSTVQGNVGLMDDLTRGGALYTALTRVTDESQIHLIGSW
jgi:hypothetical protein